MCELLPQYTMHLLALARHWHVIDKVYVSICIRSFVHRHCMQQYVYGCGVWVGVSELTIKMGVGCGYPASGLGLEPEVEWYWGLPKTLTLGSVPLWVRPTYVAISWKKRLRKCIWDAYQMWGEKPSWNCRSQFQEFFPKVRLLRVNFPKKFSRSNPDRTFQFFNF